MSHSPESLALLANLPAGVCITDADERIQWCNTRFTDLLALDADSANGMQINALPLKRKQGPDHDAALLSPDGRPNTTLLFSSAADGDGGRMVMLTDVSSMSRPSNQIDLGELAGTDLDTGLLTHNVIQKQLMTEVSRCRRYGNALSVVVVRVGAEGAPVSQDYLTAVSVRVADNLRWVDYAGRLDDSTLLLILPETGGEAAQQLVEKLKPLLNAIESSDAQSSKLASVEWNDTDDAMGLVDRARQLVG